MQFRPSPPKSAGKVSEEFRKSAGKVVEEKKTGFARAYPFVLPHHSDELLLSANTRGDAGWEGMVVLLICRQQTLGLVQLDEESDAVSRAPRI